MKPLFFSLLLAVTATSAAGAITSAGHLMFTGFNSDGNDDLSFVLLAGYSANQTIRFTDNEWDGTAWVDGNETFFNWSSAVDLPVGTVVNLSNLGSGTIGADLGTAAFTGGTNFGLASSNESVYAYLGTSDGSPTTFLTAFGNGNGGVGFSNVSQGLLDNTGLTAGVSAVSFLQGEDITAYTGARSGESAFSSYAPLLANTANWTSQNATGDQSIDSVTPDVPFNTTSFSVVPEPGFGALSMMLGVAGLLRRRR